MKKHIDTAGASTVDALMVARSSPPSIVVGVMAGLGSDGRPLVDIPGDPPRTRVPAQSCVPLRGDDVGQQVVLTADVNDPYSPIVIGVIKAPEDGTYVQITADGHHVTVRAEHSITLRCGEASISLKRDGQVVIRGKHVVTHASGINRIRGGSIELN